MNIYQVQYIPKKNQIESPSLWGPGSFLNTETIYVVNINSTSIWHMM